MIIEDLYSSLVSLGYPVKPFGTENIEDTILYEVTPISNDGVINTDRLAITVISQDFKQATSILEAVKHTLLTLGDKQFNNDILTISLNGGGSLENVLTDTYHLKAYFVVTSKFRKD